MEVKREEYVQQEIISSLAALQKPVEESFFVKYRSKCKESLLSLIQRVEDVSSLDNETVKFLDKQLTATINSFDALRHLCQHKSLKYIKPVTVIPANKNITPQLKFYSTKKKRKQKPNVKFSKPSFEKKEKFFSVQINTSMITSRRSLEMLKKKNAI